MTDLDPGREGLERAAQYLRMSTEHQNYSLGHQDAGIAEYALAHGMEIVCTYSDAGVSGLSLARRTGLKDLLADVLGGRANYSVILVYDVSRWGRFQDADEAAHYEFVCKQAGVRVEYCAELFDNDGSLASGLVKFVKRSMAGEYSRELSEKVARAHRRLAEMGYWQGGAPGYGLRRQIISIHGELGPIMADGEQKALRGNRVILVHGPPEEIAVVRRIFRLYIKSRLTRVGIARRLNADGIPAERGARWTPHRVRHILENELWAGVHVYGRTTCRLGGLPERKPQESWVRVEGAIAPVVSRGVLGVTLQGGDRRSWRISEAEMLKRLSALLREHGRLSARLINRAPGLPRAQTYSNTFGGLLAAYAKIGYAPDPEAIASARVMRNGRIGAHRQHVEPLTPDEMIDRLRRAFHLWGKLNARIISDDPELPSSSSFQRVFGDTMLAYELAGYTPTQKQRDASKRRKGMIGSVYRGAPRASRVLDR